MSKELSSENQMFLQKTCIQTPCNLSTPGILAKCWLCFFQKPLKFVLNFFQCVVSQTIIYFARDDERLECSRLSQRQQLPCAGPQWLNWPCRKCMNASTISTVFQHYKGVDKTNTVVPFSSAESKLRSFYQVTSSKILSLLLIVLFTRNLPLYKNASIFHVT